MSEIIASTDLDKSVLTEMTVDDEGILDTDSLNHGQWSIAELADLDSSISVVGFTPVAKEEMIGVPHFITRATYWTPRENRDGTLQRGFVSVEATVGSADMLASAIRRKWIPGIERLEELRLEPEEQIVYNDGGTGIRRQLTEMFDHLGVIRVTDQPTTKGDRSIYDRPWPEWHAISQLRMQGEHKVPSIGAMPTKNGKLQPLVIKVMRGLSRSDYDSDFGDATTFYLR